MLQISSVVAFRIFAGMLSGPVALFEFKEVNFIFYHCSIETFKAKAGRFLTMLSDSQDAWVIFVVLYDMGNT